APKEDVAPTAEQKTALMEGSQLESQVVFKAPSEALPGDSDRIEATEEVILPPPPPLPSGTQRESLHEIPGSPPTKDGAAVAPTRQDEARVTDLVKVPAPVLKVPEGEEGGFGESSQPEQVPPPKEVWLTPSTSDRSGLMGLGAAFQFSANPDGSSNGTKFFIARLIFPNLNRVTFRLSTDSKGCLEVIDGEKAKLTNYESGEVSGIRVSNIPGFAGRIRIDFGPKIPPLDVNLTAVHDRSGRPIHLEMADSQPKYSGPPLPFFSESPPSHREVRVLCAQLVADATQRGMADHKLRYYLYLSSG